MDYRWRLCALLFAATTLNYVDRQMLSVLAPELGRTIGWSDAQYGYIVAAFQAAYALGLLGAGWVIDRVGTRIGYALAISVWSLAAMSHALAGTALQFAAARFVLGLGEAGNFPAAVKTVAEWFPARERALATGIFNAGSNLGPILAPLIAALAAQRWGVRSAFLFTALLSLAWLVVWLRVYRSPTAGTASRPHRVPWRALLAHRQAWAFALAKLLTDPVWWFFLFWLPKFLYARYGLTLGGLGPPLITIYLMADVGSVGGGWLAGMLLRRGWTANGARKSAMLVCALCVVPIALVLTVRSQWAVVALIGLAAAAHQGWSANVYSLTSDLFPARMVASVTGLGGCAGAASGALASAGIGLLLDATHSFVAVFAVAAGAYLFALLIVQLLVPRLEPVVIRD